MNKFWSWVFLIAAGALVLLFFSNDFGLIDIQKTAIVAAIGIDRSEETEGRWSVTAQIAVPDANAKQGEQRKHTFRRNGGRRHRRSQPAKRAGTPPSCTAV